MGYRLCRNNVNLGLEHVSDGAEVVCDERTLFDLSYGSILVESNRTLNFESAELLGTTVADQALTINGERMSIDSLLAANTERFNTVYPDRGRRGEATRPADCRRKAVEYPGEPVDKVKVFIPVFPGTNCDYDTARAFRRAGAEVGEAVFRNLTSDDIFSSIDEMKRRIDECHILVLSLSLRIPDQGMMATSPTAAASSLPTFSTTAI